jgi:hypothetical protein
MLNDEVRKDEKDKGFVKDEEENETFEEKKENQTLQKREKSIGEESKGETEENPSGLSKTALKKQKKREKWRETKAKRKEEEKLKKKAKKAAKMAQKAQSHSEQNNLELGFPISTSLNQNQSKSESNSTKPEPSHPLKIEGSICQKEEKKSEKDEHKNKKAFKRVLREELKAKSVGQPFISIHLVWSSLMTEKENASMVRQLNRCYSLLYEFKKPLNLCFTDCQEPFKEKLLKNGAANWAVELNSVSLLERFPVESLVYLSGDATEDMEFFDSSSKHFLNSEND